MSEIKLSNKDIKELNELLDEVREAIRDQDFKTEEVIKEFDKFVSIIPTEPIKDYLQIQVISNA